jgi:hypothetical protein
MAKAITALCIEKNRATIINFTIEELPGRGLKCIFTDHIFTKEIWYEAAVGSEIFTSSLSTQIDTYWSNTV